MNFLTSDWYATVSVLLACKAMLENQFWNICSVGFFEHMYTYSSVE